MVSAGSTGVTFAETISLRPPSDGVERDDNRIATGDLPPPAEQLYAMNVPSIPDRAYLIKYPQGLWSGKSVASENDFRHIPGWGSNISFVTAQDAKAVAKLGQKFQRLAAHIPNILEAERELEGEVAYEPYTAHGRRDQGRESARLHDIVQRFDELKRSGVPRHSLLNVESRVNALALREARAKQQKEAIANFSNRKTVHVGSNRFAWQTPVYPGHPLYSKGWQKGRHMQRRTDYLNLGPANEERIKKLVAEGTYKQPGEHFVA
jgi:hypothetical protein